MEGTERCSSRGCERPAAGSLATRAFCREHFIINCYARLEAADERMQEHGFDDRAAESVRQFVRECVEQATNLVEKTRDLGSLERGRLLDILLWAARVGRRLRRSPRIAATLPIRVRSERPGCCWQEETKTCAVSRYGALAECGHPVITGETLQVSRLDKGREGEARVAWHRRKGSGRVEIGVEFTGGDNFWELDWSKN